jgi:hypothetical protein
VGNSRDVAYLAAECRECFHAAPEADEGVGGVWHSLCLLQYLRTLASGEECEFNYELFLFLLLFSFKFICRVC